jgi:hypothetical protein
MNINLKTVLVPVITIFIWSAGLNGQQLVESVAGIVGNEVIYLSAVENNVAQVKSSGDRTPIDKLRCKMFEELLVSKLFLQELRPLQDTLRFWRIIQTGTFLDDASHWHLCKKFKVKNL